MTGNAGEPRIGELRHRVTLQTPVRTGDGGGGASIVWTPVIEVSAAVRPATGGESLDADRLSGLVSHEIWIRYRASVTPEMRFVFGSRVFDIRAVLDVDERRRWLRCLVEEKDV